MKENGLNHTTAGEDGIVNWLREMAVVGAQITNLCRNAELTILRLNAEIDKRDAEIAELKKRLGGTQ